MSCHVHVPFDILLFFSSGYDRRFGMGRKDEMFGRLFIKRKDSGELSLVIGLRTYHLKLFFFVDLVNGQRPNHSRHTEERRNLFQIGLASKQGGGGTNGRRGSGGGQQISRQIHFGWVSLSTE
jgi:hypothetical protein